MVRIAPNQGLQILDSSPKGIEALCLARIHQETRAEKMAPERHLGPVPGMGRNQGTAQFRSLPFTGKVSITLQGEGSLWAGVVDREKFSVERAKDDWE